MLALMLDRTELAAQPSTSRDVFDEIASTASLGAILGADHFERLTKSLGLAGDLTAKKFSDDHGTVTARGIFGQTHWIVSSHFLPRAPIPLSPHIAAALVQRAKSVEVSSGGILGLDILGDVDGPCERTELLSIDAGTSSLLSTSVSVRCKR
jgi:hypothetical protein